MSNVHRPSLFDGKIHVTIRELSVRMEKSLQTDCVPQKYVVEYS